MPTVSTFDLNDSHEPQDACTQVVLREARRLHRAAVSDSLAVALPVLRRLLAARAVPGTLPLLFRSRATVQRKHVLRTLAREAGHDSWEAYRRALPTQDLGQIRRALEAERGTATLKLWFVSEDAAQVFATRQGGQAVRVAGHAVVLPTAPGHNWG